MSKKFLQAREAAAAAIFESGSYSLDLKNGHKISIHQQYPDAPRPRLYFHIRPEGYREGKLNAAGMSAVGRALALGAKQFGLLGKTRAVAGIPAAGVPLLDAMLLQLPEQTRRQLTCVPLEKQEVNGCRSFLVGHSIHLTTSDYQRTLLVDDLVQSALSKLLATDAIEQDGGKVTELLVFSDQSFDASDVLLKHGIQLYAVWEPGCLLEWALAHNYFTRGEYETIVEHQIALRKFLKSVA